MSWKHLLILLLPLPCMAQSSPEFSLSLHRRLSVKENLVHSPFSVSSAFALAYLGARGETESQMKSVFGYSDNLSPVSLNPAVSSTNALFIQEGFPILDPYLTAVSKFNGEIGRVNFKSPKTRDEVNQFVASKTGGRIRELFNEPFDPTSAAVLVNALHFKGKWQKPFARDKSVEGDFFKSASEITRGIFFSDRRQIGYLKSNGFSAISLNYQEGLVFVAVLPDGELDSFVKNLDLSTFARLTSDFDLAMVSLKLPRFKIDTRLSLSKTLSKLGMPAAFSEQDADFSGIESRRLFYISKAVTEATIEVNEEGTEAAAGTGIEFAVRGMPPKPQEFIANRPFFFLIFDPATKTGLFMGEVYEPGM